MLIASDKHVLSWRQALLALEPKVFHGRDEPEKEQKVEKKILQSFISVKYGPEKRTETRQK